MSLSAIIAERRRAVEPGRDLDGLERYIPAYIGRAVAHAGSGLAARRQALRIATAVKPERFEKQASTEAVIPEAFEAEIGYLGYLDSISGVLQFTSADLSAEEAQGLVIFRRAREKYWAEHLSCPACQSVNLRSSGFCGGCGKEFS